MTYNTLVFDSDLQQYLHFFHNDLSGMSTGYTKKRENYSLMPVSEGASLPPSPRSTKRASTRTNISK